MLVAYFSVGVLAPVAYFSRLPQLDFGEERLPNEPKPLWKLLPLGPKRYVVLPFQIVVRTPSGPLENQVFPERVTTRPDQSAQTREASIATNAAAIIVRFNIVLSPLPQLTQNRYLRASLPREGPCLPLSPRTTSGAYSTFG